MNNHSFGFKMESAPINVDYWNSTDSEISNRFHFLTHAHDHSIFGLNSSWRHPIYCSRTTARILVATLDLHESIFEILEIGRARSIGDDLLVTGLDAEHCPGSIMFVFEGGFGRILATGAFRFDGEMEMNLSGPIDHLYLDATNYGWEEKEGGKTNWGSRTMSTIRGLQAISRRPETETIFLVTPECSLGQESLLVSIAENFQTKIAVRQHRLKIFNEILDSRILTDDPSETRFRLVTGARIQILDALRDSIGLNPTTALVFVGPHEMRRWRSFLENDDPRDSELRSSIRLIPFTDHSSTDELLRFLRRLEIRRLHLVGTKLDESTIEALRRQFETPVSENRGQADGDRATNGDQHPEGEVQQEASSNVQSCRETPTDDQIPDLPVDNIPSEPLEVRIAHQGHRPLLDDPNQSPSINSSTSMDQISDPSRIVRGNAIDSIDPSAYETAIDSGVTNQNDRRESPSLEENQSGIDETPSKDQAEEEEMDFLFDEANNVFFDDNFLDAFMKVDFDDQ